MAESGYDGDRVTVVPNGVPTSTNGRDDRLPTAPWILGTVALFRPRKGTEVLIEALAKLKARGVDVRLRAVGGFETTAYQSQLKSLAEELDVASQIDWVGFTDDVPSELTKMDLFVLPSLFGEGLPVVILEAMAAGVPNVATQVLGVPEAIRDGIDGVLTEPGDATDLADGIHRIVRGDLNWYSLRESALRRHDNHFSDFSMARGVADVYQKLLR